MERPADRQRLIIDVLEDAFADLMAADARAFRVKYRKMAADPFAFYRGTACLFYADVTTMPDRWADDRTSRIWIHGDLHAENFGSYMNSDWRLVFDVNDFDEAYIGHFSWDLRRFVASLALMGWQKALPEATIRSLVGTYLRAYIAQVTHYLESEADDDFALHLGNTEGPVAETLVAARLASRVALLDGITRLEDSVRMFSEDVGVRRLGRTERRKVGVDARVVVSGVAYQVDPNLAGETVVLWWGLFDDELYVEHGEHRYGPYQPLSGPIPLHRYRRFKKTVTEQRFERIEALAMQLVLPRTALTGLPQEARVAAPSAPAIQPFVDPAPFHSMIKFSVLDVSSGGW